MKKLVKGIIFILLLIALMISMKLFYNLGIFVDENNLSPADVYGGNFELALSWIRLIILALLCLLSGINLFVKEMKSN